MSCCCAGRSSVRFLQPWDGDILNRHDGKAVEGGLEIVVRGEAPPNAAVIVNGVPMRRDGGTFVGSVVLRDFETTLTARTVPPEAGGERGASVPPEAGGERGASVPPEVGGEGGASVPPEVGGEGGASITVLWDRRSFPRYRFSVDDNIQFLKDLAVNATRYDSLFDNWYLAFWRDMNRRYGARIQLNIYYATDERDFNLSQLSDRYRDEWRANADWLRLTFHAYADMPNRPYIQASYEEIERDYLLITREIERFAGPELLSPFTTIHWGEATLDGCRALRDHGMRGFAGYFVLQNDQPAVSYYLNRAQTEHLNARDYWKDTRENILFVKHDQVVNTMPLERVVPHLEEVTSRPHEAEVLELMVHEQYFCPFLRHYQPDIPQRVEAAIRCVTEKGYKPIFFEEGFLGA
jgi:hypothetical protein